MSTFYVANEVQAALYECELKGQISDGNWENSRPWKHWHAPCDADVVVNTKEQGRDFSVLRTYSFNNGFLVECVGDRMLAIAQMADRFPAASFSCIDAWSSIFDYSDERIAELGWMQDYVKRIVDELGMSISEVRAECAKSAYDLRSMRRELAALTKAFKVRL